MFVPGFASHVEFQREEPLQSQFFEPLPSFARLIRFDKRGAGLSDPVPTMPTFEQRMDDVRAGMDAAGSQRAVVMGLSEGGPLAMLFGASYPNRTVALVLLNTFPRMECPDPYPVGATAEVNDQFAVMLESVSTTRVRFGKAS